MKYIQSFWSKPSFHNVQDYANSRKFGGWLSYKYFIISSLFSCLTIRRHHKKVELYTDNDGYNLLIEKFSLPYDEVTLNLNILSNEDHRLWALGKLLTLQSQDDPFIHFDNDIYIWEKIPANISPNYVLAQSSMPMPNVYLETLDEINNNFNYIPQYLREGLTIANIGLIGGNNIMFFKKYCNEAINFLEKNRDVLDKIHIGRFNQILDEFLFICLATELNQPISFHIDSSHELVPLESVLRFHLTPLIDKYIHLVGIAKQNFFACEQLEMRFKFEFPQHFKFYSEKISEHYLFNSEESDSIVINNMREKRMYNAIKFLYMSSISEIMNKKCKIIDELEFIEITDNLNCENTKYIIKGIDPVSGQNIERELQNKDILLGCFINPVNLNNVLEELRSTLNFNSKKELELYEFSFIDWITEKIFITGEVSIYD